MGFTTRANSRLNLVDSADFTLKEAAQNHELRFQLRRLQLGLRGNKQLENPRFRSEGRWSDRLVICRYIPPSNKVETLGCTMLFDYLLALVSNSLLLGEEDESCSIFSLGRKLDALLFQLDSIECVWDCNKEARSISGVYFTSTSSTMCHSLQNLQNSFI
jgi:hypothetical protein